MDPAQSATTTAPQQELEPAVISAIKQKVADLYLALQDTLPEFPTLLKTIHKNIRETPGLSMVLSEDEIHVLVQGYEKQAQITVVQSKIKTGSKLKGSQISTDMI